MKNKLILCLLLCAISGCSSTKKRETQILDDQRIASTLKKEESLGQESSIGVDEKGHVVQLNKIKMAEYLQTLKYETLKEYEALYGIREYSSQGLAGKVDSCNFKASQKKFGGDGVVPKPIERTDILNVELLNEWKNFKKDQQSSDINAITSVGYDSKEQLTGVTKENILETVARFQDYRKSLAQKRLELEQSLRVCEAKLEANTP